MGTSIPPTQGDNGATVITPQTFSETGPKAPNASVNAASDAARALIASQGTALPAAPPQPGTTPETPIREVPAANPANPAQPRASDGTFGTPLPPDPNAPPAPNAPNAPPQPGQAPQSDAPAEGEGEPPAEATATVVPIEVNGEALDLDVGDPAVADVIRQHIETAREAETIRAESERTIEEVVAIREHIQIDPVGFVLRELRESPAGQEHLLLSLLTQPDVFERVKPKLDAMLRDPRDLALTRAEQQAARSQFAQEARHQVEEGRAVRENLRDVKATCAAIARLLPPEVAPVAYNDMLRDLQSYADHANLMTIPPEHIPVALANRLTALGIDPVEAAKHAATSRAKLGKNGKVTPPRATATATPRPGGVPLPPRSAPTGQQFVASRESRKAAAIPAAGAGSPSVGPDLVPPTKADGSPMSIAETTAWHREQIKLGKRGTMALTR